MDYDPEVTRVDLWWGIGSFLVLHIAGFLYNYVRLTERVENLKENTNLRIDELEKMLSERLDRVQTDIREIRGFIARQCDK